MSNNKKVAKTASKNNPTTRGAKIKYKVNGLVVAPARYHDFEAGKKYMCVRFVESKTLLLDSEGNPCRWTATNKERTV
jgi:hypothetical protein